MSAHERHNRLAPELVKTIVTETRSEAEAMVLVESTLLGVLMFFRSDRRAQIEFLDEITRAVVERMVA